jgi:hypothetical protein
MTVNPKLIWNGEQLGQYSWNNRLNSNNSGSSFLIELLTPVIIGLIILAIIVG